MYETSMTAIPVASFASSLALEEIDVECEDVSVAPMPAHEPEEELLKEEPVEAIQCRCDSPVYISPQESDKFWFEDGNVVLQAGSTLYKVYKGILTRHSEYFRSRITVTFQAPLKKKGRTLMTYGEPRLVGVGSDSDPLPVLGVKEDDFELLLSYMFPEDYNSQNNFTVSDWATIAAISKDLEITSVRGAAIANILKAAEPLDLIDIGKKHNLAECNSEGLRQLCVREASLTLKEGQRLGLEGVIAIAHGRDLLSKGSKWSKVEGVVLWEARIFAKVPAVARLLSSSRLGNGL